MTLINTLLPPKVNALISIPDGFMQEMVAHLRDNTIIEVVDGYDFVVDIKPYVHASAPSIASTNHQYLSTLLISKYPLELMMFYQQDAVKLVNVELLIVLVATLQRDPLYITARINDTSKDIGDVVESDQSTHSLIPKELYNDQDSYDVMVDIIAQLSN